MIFVDSFKYIWKINHFITSSIIRWKYKPKVLDKDPVQFHWWFISLEGSTRYLLPHSFPSADAWNNFAQTHSSEIQFPFFFCLCYGQKNISCCVLIPVFFDRRLLLMFGITHVVEPFNDAKFKTENIISWQPTKSGYEPI